VLGDDLDGVEDGGHVLAGEAAVAVCVEITL